MEKSSSLSKQLFLSEILLTKDIVEKYDKLETDEKRFKLALVLITQCSDVLFDPKCKEKIVEHSISSRQDGNSNFFVRQYWEAIKQYTESIMYAEDSSEEQALSFGNRSAASFELRQYSDCIKDIDRALNLKYPDKFRTKLLKRKATSLALLGEPGAVSSFKEALIWLDKITASEADRIKMENELKELIANPPGIFKLPDGVMSYPVPEIITPIPEMLTPNPEIPSASDAVAIAYSETLGQHLVATRAIKPGEILIVEKPYCQEITPDQIYTHCSHCLLVSYSMIACKFCVHVAYCSEDCRDSAWNEYHEIECPILGLMSCFGANAIYSLGTRITIKAIQKGQKLHALQKELKSLNRRTDQRTKGYGEDRKFHSDQYRSIYTLRNKTDACSAMKGLAGALFSALTVYALARETQMFGKNLRLDALTKNPDILFYGALMLRNVHIVMSKIQILGLSDPSSFQQRGYILATLSSVANHSCDSNTCMQSYEKHSCLYAAYPIAKGEQITNSFGPRYFMMPHDERQLYLKNQNINCKCDPCTKNWPESDNLLIVSYKNQPLAQEDKKKLDDYLKEFSVIYQELAQEDVTKYIPEMLNEVVKMIEVIHSIVKKPCSELNRFIVLLRDLYAAVEYKFDYSPVYPPEVDTQCVIFFLWLKNLLSLNKLRP